MVGAVGALDTRPMQAGPITAKKGPCSGRCSTWRLSRSRARGWMRESDLFAFGAVLYEMVTGRRAFDGESPASLIAAILGSEPPLVSTVQPMVPVALDRLVRGCLAKDPDDRWQDARNLRRALDQISDESGQTSRAATALAHEPAPAQPRRSVGTASRSSSALRPHSGAALALWRPLSSTAPRPLVRSVIPIAPAEELRMGQPAARRHLARRWSSGLLGNADGEAGKSTSGRSTALRRSLSLEPRMARSHSSRATGSGSDSGPKGASRESR